MVIFWTVFLTILLNIFFSARSVASTHYQLGLAQAYSGKMTEAEANLQSAISILEGRKVNIAKLENSDSVAMEKIDLETCIQEIKEVIVDQKEMQKQIATGLLTLIFLYFCPFSKLLASYRVNGCTATGMYFSARCLK